MIIINQKIVQAYLEDIKSTKDTYLIKTKTQDLSQTVDEATLLKAFENKKLHWLARVEIVEILGDSKLAAVTAAFMEAFKKENSNVQPEIISSLGRIGARAPLAVKKKLVDFISISLLDPHFIRYSVAVKALTKILFSVETMQPFQDLVNIIKENLKNKLKEDVREHIKFDLKLINNRFWDIQLEI